MVGRTKRKTRNQRVRRGRVSKPRRLAVRRRRNKVVRRIRKPPQEEPQQVPGQEFKCARVCSISTAHTDDSSPSRSECDSSHCSTEGDSSRCSLCGHRRKNQRSEENIDGYHQHEQEPAKKGKENESNRRKNQRGRRVPPKKKTAMLGHTTEEEGIQAGSRSKVLSPLFVATNKTLSDEPTPSHDNSSYTQITPEMIYEALTSLTKWKQEVPLPPILEYIKINYPVNNDSQELAEELTFKLAIATITGMLTQEVRESVKYWALTTELIRQGFNKNHVTLFWKLYCDTMSPVKRKELQDHQHFENQVNLVCEGWRRRSLCVCQPQPKCSSQCRCQPFPPPPCQYEPPSSSNLLQDMGFSCRKRILQIAKRVSLEQGPQRRNSHKSSEARRGTFKKRAVRSRETRRRARPRHKRSPRGILKSKDKGRKCRQKQTIPRRTKPPACWDFKHRNSLQMLLKRRNRMESVSNSTYTSKTSSQESLLLNNENSFHQSHDLERIHKNTRGIRIRDSRYHFREDLSEPDSKREDKTPFNDIDSLKNNNVQETTTQTKAACSKQFSISINDDFQSKNKLQNKTEGSVTGRSDTNKLSKAASKQQSLHIEIPYEGSENTLNTIFNVISGKNSVQLTRKATVRDSSQGDHRNTACDTLLKKTLEQTNKSWLCS